MLEWLPSITIILEGLPKKQYIIWTIFYFLTKELNLSLQLINQTARAESKKLLAQKNSVNK